MPVSSRSSRSAGVLGVTLLLARGAEAAAPTPELGEVVVTATLRNEPLTALAASATVLEAATLESGTQHLEELLGLVPNLNWSAGSSRPRYFQLRGIGELEQYEGAPNPSVGLLIDDIDFSGLGMVATLFDLERVEILRGPQGTRYGANALGGLIYARSQAPSDEFAGRIEVGGGDYGTRSAGVAVGGPLPELDSTVRLALQRYRSDGYYRNLYLNANTDQRDELTARLRWRYRPGPRLTVDLSLLHASLANGYDAFAIDNTRAMRSDHPGEDSQRATGVSLRASYAAPAGRTLTLIATEARSASIQAYDGDWGNPLAWAPYTYDYLWRSDNLRTTRTLEARYAGGDWVYGAYGQELSETIRTLSRGTYANPFDPTQNAASDDLLASRYRARSYALFGEQGGALSPRVRWSAGARLERRVARYADASQAFDSPAGSNAFAPQDTMAGGQLSLAWAPAPDRNLYAAVSRGYKAGGFNLAARLPPGQRTFQPEALWNLELGYKAALAAPRLELATALFYMQRERLQIRSSEQLVPGDPNTFVFYTANAAHGFNAGFEGNLAWQASPALALHASAGVLRTRYQDFHLGLAPVPDRAQPHAPSWQGALGARWRAGPEGWFARLDLTGMGAFYFDVPPNPTSAHAYTLVNAGAGYERARWTATLEVQNAFNREHVVRGFYFGNQPPDFTNQLYTQLGDPRTAGIRFTLRL